LVEIELFSGRSLYSNREQSYVPCKM